MGSLIALGVIVTGGCLITRYLNDSLDTIAYVRGSLLAAASYALLSFLYKRFIHVFYTSPLLDLPLIKRKTWGECFGLIQAPRYLEAMEDLRNDGLLRRLDTLNRECVIVTTPRVAAEFFQQRSDDYIKWPAMSRVLKDILGSGMITAEGHDHKMQRKAVSPAFNPSAIKNLYPVFWSKARHCVTLMKSSIALHEVNEEKAILDMADFASRVSLDIISDAGFGTDFESLDKPQNDLNRWYRSAFMVEGPIRLFYLLSVLTHPTFVNQFSFVQIIKTKLEGVRGVREWIGQAIDSRKNEMREKADEMDGVGKNSHKDIVSAMMKSGILNTDGLIEQSLTFLGAGHETTATSFTWALHELAQPEHQHYQTALRNEIRVSLPPPSSGAPLTAEMLEDLPLLDCIVKENLRLHAPAPVTGRIAARDTVLAGRHIPKGVAVRISPWAMGRSTKFWGEDATTFRPERWEAIKTIDKDADPQASRDIHLLHNITFGHGPRGCIGKGFAIASLKALLAATVGSFELKQVGDKHVEPETVFTVTGKIKELNLEVSVVDGW